MMYRLIEIWTSEEARWQGEPAYLSIMDLVRKARIASRCMVTKAWAGCYENGELASAHVEILSFNMPIKLEILLPEAELPMLLPKIQERVVDGIITLQAREMVSYHSHKQMIPRQLRVRDVMTAQPIAVHLDTPVSEVLAQLLKAPFHSMPVVDETQRPMGLITQGDLIRKARMPLRLGLLNGLATEDLNDYLTTLSGLRAKDIMACPLWTVPEDQKLDEAVRIMLKRNLKRLPVVNDREVMTGFLARFDVFRFLAEASPNWTSFQECRVQVGEPHQVKDILERDVHIVHPDASIDTVLHLIDRNSIQRVAVVDEEGTFLGLIFDRDLLGQLSGHKVNLLEMMSAHLSFTELFRRRQEQQKQARCHTAGEIMRKDMLTIHEHAPLEEALAIMVAHGIKRLPVLNTRGQFQGLISRESLLRAGMAPGKNPDS